MFDANGSAITTNPATGFTTAYNTALSIPASSLLANDTDSAGATMSITGVSNPSNGTVTYNSSISDGHLHPRIAVISDRPASSYSISDHEWCDRARAPRRSRSTTRRTRKACSFPAIRRLRPISGEHQCGRARGQVSGLDQRHDHRHPLLQGLGEHGHPCRRSVECFGYAAATATFTNETATGWQEADFSSPVAIAAGTTYVASYHTNTGEYSVDPNYYANAYTNGQLTVPSSSSSGGDGVYTYSSSPAFPTNSFNAANYWVDVVFDANAPVVTANPVSGLLLTTENTTLSIPASTLLANDTDSQGYPLSISGVSNPSNGTVSYNSSNQPSALFPTPAMSARPASPIRSPTGMAEPDRRMWRLPSTTR